MEEIEMEFDVTGEINIISLDENIIIVYEQKLSKNGFYPLSMGVYRFTFKQNVPVEILSISSWEEFEKDYHQKLENKQYRPLWLDEEEYPEWFPPSNLKHQLLYLSSN